MTETKDSRIKSQELVPGLLIIFLSLIISVLIPFVAPALAILLLVIGVYIYKHATDSAMRTIAVAAITSGILILLMVIIMLFLMTWHTTATSSIEKYPGR